MDIVPEHLCVLIVEQLQKTQQIYPDNEEKTTVDEVEKIMGRHCNIESIAVSVAVPIAVAANIPFEWERLYLKSAPLSSQISLVRRVHNTVHSTSQRSVYSQSKCDQRKVAVSKSSK